MAWGLGQACAAGAAVGMLHAVSRPWIPDNLPCSCVHMGIVSGMPPNAERALASRNPENEEGGADEIGD